MSTCGDCNCADKSQCVKKGNINDMDGLIETKKGYYDDVVEEVPVADATMEEVLVANAVEEVPAAGQDGVCKCKRGGICYCGICNCHY